MPTTGSQITICDVPVRYDTYEGCSHACRYCFVNRKRDISHIKRGEGVEALKSFIQGNRTNLLKWLDWDIPLHFGGMSDPFQPIERTERRTLEALKVFAETQYPFIVSTKNKLIAEEPYLSLIKQCNCVVQFSAVCPQYNSIERGASTFEERMEAAAKISPYKRVIIRVQPYLPELKANLLQSLQDFAGAGAYGITIEGMKYIIAKKGTVRVGGDNCYPKELLARDFAEIKAKTHALGMRFFCAENRLRSMGDDLCCCGIEGLGWKTNTGNLVHMLFDKENVHFSKAQKTEDVMQLMHHIKQQTLAGRYGDVSTFEKLMNDSFRTKAELLPLIGE